MRRICISHRRGETTTKKDTVQGRQHRKKKRTWCTRCSGLQMARQKTPSVVNRSSPVLMQHIKILGKHPTRKKNRYMYRKKQWAVLFTLHLVQARMATCPSAMTNQGKNFEPAAARGERQVFPQKWQGGKQERWCTQTAAFARKVQRRVCHRLKR